MKHFYQVLASEQYFPGAKFCNMIKIYNDWGRGKSKDDKIKVTCKIPETLLDVMEFQVDSNITKCRTTSPNLVDEFIANAFIEKGNTVFETVPAAHDRVDSNNIKIRYTLDQDLGLTCEGKRYVNYIIMRCCLNKWQP